MGRIERRDGIGIGLTAHDRDLTIDGNRYRATPGMTPSAIRRADGSDADTMDVEGAFASAAIREDELAAEIIELADAAKGPVLREYLRRFGWEVGKLVEGLSPSADEAELAAAAPGFPVFRIDDRAVPARP